MAKHNVLISTGYIKQIEKLSDSQAKDLLIAICAYQEEEDMPELDAVTDMLFSIIKDEIDENTARYQETKEKRAEAAKKRWDAEKSKSMQVDANDANACKSMQVGANDADSDSVSVYVNDNDYVSPNGDIKEKGISKDIPKKKSAKAKPEKVSFGEYHNVKLTLDEYAKLASDYGEPVRKACITFLDEYIAEKGYKSKSHYLAIRRWVVDAVNKKQPVKTDDFMAELERWVNDG